MPKGTTKRRPQTVARLLDAARELFAEQGFGSTTIVQVCERAGYTRGAFYSNFATMDDLFFALYDAYADEDVDRWDEALTELDGDVSLELTVKKLAHVDTKAASWFVVSAEFTLYAIRNPQARRLLGEHQARVRAHIVDLLAKMLERTGRTADFDLDQLARLFAATRDGSLAQSLVDPENLPPGHLEETFWPMLFRSLSH
jgi:AcrR family transcriptional regulator